MSDQTRRKATEPEQIAELFIERSRAGDAEGLAEPYEPDAVIGYPPGQTTSGREAIRAVYSKMLEARPDFKEE